MTPPLFLVARSELEGDTVVLAGREGHHAVDVRRSKVGERVDVGDGRGLRLRCQVASVSRGELTLSVLDRVVEAPPVPCVTVAQALIKQDAADRALAGMTEVGVDAVLAWQAERSVVRWSPDRVQRGIRRWQASVAEAAKQSRRAWVPTVTGPATSSDLVEHVRSVDLALVLDREAKDAVGSVDLAGVGSLLLVVGPEGGHSDGEAALLTDAGARPVHLGPTVLRSATAGTVATGVLLSRTPRWNRQASWAAAG